MFSQIQKRTISSRPMIRQALRVQHLGDDVATEQVGETHWKGYTRTIRVLIRVNWKEVGHGLDLPSLFTGRKEIEHNKGSLDLRVV